MLGIAAWILIVAGIITLVVGLDEGPGMGFVFVLVGLAMAVFGVIFLALVQIGRANVHSAEINWEMLVLAREAGGQRSQFTSPGHITMHEETANVAAPNTSTYNSRRSHYDLEDQDIESARSTKQFKDRDGNFLKAFIFEGGTVKVEKDGAMLNFRSFLEATEFFNPE